MLRAPQVATKLVLPLFAISVLLFVVLLWVFQISNTSDISIYKKSLAGLIVLLLSIYLVVFVFLLITTLLSVFLWQAPKRKRLVKYYVDFLEKNGFPKGKYLSPDSYLSEEVIGSSSDDQSGLRSMAFELLGQINLPDCNTLYRDALDRALVIHNEK